MTTMMATQSIFNWTDVTKKFKDACGELNSGELLKDSNFGLFEAMSAIEIMDPKMDAGMVENQSQSKIKSLKQAIDDKLIKIDNFTLEEKIAIVDNTLCNLVTWLDGASLAQTLFTNLYLHDPNVVEDAYIKTFSIAMLKLIDLMRNKIVVSATFEEEDFQPMHYNFKFAQDQLDSNVLSMLKTADDNSAKYYRHVKGEAKPDSEADKKLVDLAHAVWMRIKFVRSLFQIMQYTDEYSAFNKNSEEIFKHVNNGLEAMAKIKETHSLGVEPQMVKVAKTTYPVVMGFEPTINQRLLPPTFPRFIRIYSFEPSCDYLNELLAKLKEAAKLTGLNVFHNIFELGLSFSKIQSAFLRSTFQLIALPRTPLDKVLKMKEILYNTVQKFVSPPILDPKSNIANREICIQLVDSFLNKCTNVFINLLQILGHNKARQREKFGHIFDDFSTLQDEADNLDSIFNSMIIQQKLPIPNLPCFSSWILFNNLNLMYLYLISGFELELFSKFEYHYVYWYLCEIILNWQTNTLTRVDNFLLTLEQKNAANQKNNKKTNKKKNKSLYEKEIAILTAERHMFSAYYQCMRAFKEDNHIVAPNDEFDCEEFRYNHRFSPFQYFSSPPICMYHHYKEKDANFVKSFGVNKLYVFAQEHFEMARVIYEKFPECQQFTKIAKTNFVVMRLLSSGLKKVEKLEIDFSEHSYFPLIRI